MQIGSRKYIPRSGPLGILSMAFAGSMAVCIALVIALFIGSTFDARADSGAFDTASLRKGDARSIVPVDLRPASGQPMPRVKSRIQALRQLDQLETDLRGSRNPDTAARTIQPRMEAVEQFLQARRRDAARTSRHQWHRAGQARPEAGSNRAVLRPKTGLPYTSALDLEIRGAPMQVDFVRAYGASGLVFEFHPRRTVGSKEHGKNLRCFLDREIVLTAVEVIFQPKGPAVPELALEGGIAVEPPSAMNALHSLKLAKTEMQRRRFEAAALRIRESINFVESMR